MLIEEVTYYDYIAFSEIFFRLTLRPISAQLYYWILCNIGFRDAENYCINSKTSYFPTISSLTQSVIFCDVIDLHNRWRNVGHVAKIYPGDQQEFSSTTEKVYGSQGRYDWETMKTVSNNVIIFKPSLSSTKF